MWAYIRYKTCIIKIVDTHKNTDTTKQSTETITHTHTHNRFTAGLEYVRVHPGQQVPER